MQLIEKPLTHGITANGGIILFLNLENGCGGKYEQNT